MATAFNLTAQLNLRGPNNVNKIAADIRRQLGTVKGDVDIKINANAARNVTQLSAALKTLNTSLADTRVNAASAATAISAFVNAAGGMRATTAATANNIAKVATANNQLAASARTTAKQIAVTRTEMEEFGRQSALAVRRFAAFSAVTSVIVGLTNSFKQALGAFVEFDRAFVKLQQVTGKSGSELQSLSSEVTSLSIGLGVASSDLIEVAQTLAQAGLSARETEKALKALALSSLAPSFDSMNETVEGSIALMRQFGISAGSLEKALGSVNAVAAGFAVEASDIITAIQRTGGVFAAASKGVSEGTDALNEFIAVFTSVRATTRESAETIATGLRTIFTRLQRESTIEALREFGVSLTDAEGKFVGVYKAVQLLSEGLGRLDPRDIKFGQIVEELGGFRQIGKVIPLIQQFATAQEALKIAQAGQGSLANDAVKAQLSLANQIAKVREEFLALGRDIGSSDTFQTLAKSALGFASGLIKVASALRGVLPILTILGISKGLSALTQFGSGFIGGLQKVKGGGSGGGSSGPVGPTGTRSPSGGGGTTTIDFSGLNDSLKNNMLAIESLNNTLSNIMTSLGGLTQLSTDIQNNTASLTANTASVDALTAIQTSTATSLSDFSSNIASLSADVRDLINTMGSGGAPSTMNIGGVVRKFARGGVVPGVGNSDTVPAMLMPGEFVIRKKAVETIGANNLHEMNRYGSGGSISSGRSGRRRKFARGGAVPIASIDKITDYKDGDTFSAIVTPKAEPFEQEFRVADYDAWEKDNPQNPLAYSRTTSDRYKKIKSFKKNQNLLDLFQDDKKRVPGSAVVTKNRTAWDLAYEATGALKTAVENKNKAELLQGIKSENDFIGRRLISGIKIDDMYTTGRFETKLASGGIVQKFMAGGKAKEVRPFGSGSFPFPRRISNAYFRELDDITLKKKQDEIFGGGIFGLDETRIRVDDDQVSKAAARPFDRSKFLETFKQKMARSQIYENMADFAKFIGLPQEDLSLVLPTNIDFAKRLGGFGFGGASGQFDRTGMGVRGVEGYDLSAGGFTKGDEQDLYGYQKLIEEKRKQVQKIIKTPVKTYDDGSFSYDDEAAKKAWSEVNDLEEKVYQLKKKKSEAEKQIMDQMQTTAAQTGRGTVSIGTGPLSTKRNDTFYHELTHQLFQGLRTRSAESFDKYKSKVISLFEGENGDALADAFDALENSYNSADVVYGRSYKIGLLDTAIANNSKGSGTRSALTPTAPKEAYDAWSKALGIKKAREFKGLNPIVNKALLDNSIKQSVIDRVEDSGKEEFLTTLIQNAPKLDSSLQGALDSTIVDLLSSAGISRQAYAAGGVVQRKVGYIDYDVIANEANKNIVEAGMKSTGSTGPRIYADKLTQLAVQARKNSSIEKLRAIYGVAGSGKTTLARGQGTDNATLRQTERFPILTPEDIERATEILVLSSSVSKDKLDNMFGYTDRTYTLSSTTQAERERVKSRRSSRDLTGIGLEGRQPGTTSGVSTDTAVGEALLANKLGDKSVVLGQTDTGRLRTKKGDELVDIIKKKIAFTWGGFAPTTAGHESIMDAASAMGFSPEDFIALVGANEGIKAGDPSSYRTAVFDQDFRVLLAKAGFGARGATVLPKPRDFEVPQAFDISQEGSDRRQVLIPKRGSRAFVADKTPEQMSKYKDAGYSVTNLERTGGISGTMVRDLIMSGNMAKLQKVLSPGVYDIISNNIGRLKNRADVLPDIIEQVKKNHASSVSDIDKQIEAIGIKRIDSKKVASDPQYAAQAELLLGLREKKKKLQSAASFEPYRLLADLARSQPEKYGLDFGSPRLSSMSGVEKLSVAPQAKNFGGLIQRFMAGGVSEAIPDTVGALAASQKRSITDVLQDQILALGRIQGIREILRKQKDPRYNDPRLSSVLRLNNIKDGKNIEEAQGLVNVALQAKGTADAAEQARIDNLTKVGIVGLVDDQGRLDYSKDFDWDIGDGREVYANVRGFQGKYMQAVQQMQKETAAAAANFAENTQYLDIFDGGKLAFDFDDTLVAGATILGSDGKPDPSKFNDRKSVEEALRKGRPTKLAVKLKSLIDADPNFIKQTRILTARSQSTADLLAQTLQSFGLPYQESDITGTGVPGNQVPAAKTANLQAIEKLIDDDLATIAHVQKSGKKGFLYTEPKLSSDLDLVFGQGNIEGAVVEKALAMLGANLPPIDQLEQNRAIDFPDGLGRAAQFFGIRSDIPTEVKRTLNGDSFAKAREEFGRFFTENADRYAVGGKAAQSDVFLQKYKQLLASILPAEMITKDGLLRTPDGKGESIQILPPEKPKSWLSGLLGQNRSKDSTIAEGASYSGGLLFKVIRDNLESAKDGIPDKEFQILKNFIDQNLLFEGNEDTIDLRHQRRPGSLAHESFHDIQGYLLDYYPEIYKKLQQGVDGQRKNIEAWYTDPSTSKWRTNKDYSLKHIFPEEYTDSPYKTVMGTIVGTMRKGNRNQPFSSQMTELAAKAQMDLGRIEAIPVLMAAAAEGNSGAQKILSEIFGGAGLNKDFYKYMPKFAAGGKADPFDDVRGYGQLSGGLAGLITGLYGEPGSITRQFQGAGITQGFDPDEIRGMPGGLHKSSQPKEYGKIGLTEDTGTISAGYFKNDTRSGYVNAYKMRDYLYYVGLSKATSGYGPRLYDVVMEAVSEKGAMLTSDRSSVSGDAKRVWEYYFKNRGDVKKTPLKPDDWTRNNAYIDPKLYGKEETWPPSTDPAWILQSGYSKGPSLINDPASVIRTNKKQDSQNMALEFFQRAAKGGSIRKFAKGGSAEDTVPALLTPGEFVINKQAAQKIGYSKLHKLNHADKLQGYNKGGLVGIQKFMAGGTPDPDLIIDRSSLSIDFKSLLANSAMSLGRSVEDLAKSIKQIGDKARKDALSGGLSRSQANSAAKAAMGEQLGLNTITKADIRVIEDTLFGGIKLNTPRANRTVDVEERRERIERYKADQDAMPGILRKPGDFMPGPSKNDGERVAQREAWRKAREDNMGSLGATRSESFMANKSFEKEFTSVVADIRKQVTSQFKQLYAEDLSLLRKFYSDKFKVAKTDSERQDIRTQYQAAVVSLQDETKAKASVEFNARREEARASIQAKTDDRLRQAIKDRNPDVSFDKSAMVADIKAKRDAAEFTTVLGIRAKQAGMGLGLFAQSVKEQVIALANTKRENAVAAVEEFRATAAGKAEAIRGGDDKAESVLKYQMRSAIGDQASPDQANSIIENFIKNIKDNPSMSTTDMIANNKALSQILNQRLDEEENFNKAVEEYAARLGVSGQQLTSIVNQNDRINAKLMAGYSQSADTIGKWGTRIGLLLGSLSSSLSDAIKSLGGTDNRGAAIGAAATEGALKTTGAAVTIASRLPGALVDTKAVLDSKIIPVLSGATKSVASYISGGIPKVLALLTNPFTIAGVAIGAAALGLAAALKQAHNAAKAFDKAMNNKNIELGMEKVAKLFEDFEKDLRQSDVLQSIKTQLEGAVGAALENLRIDTQVPDALWLNLFDALRGGKGATDRSLILQKYGTGAYLESSQFGQSGIIKQIGFVINAGLLTLPERIAKGLSGGRYSFGVGPNNAEAKAADARRSYYMGLMAPELARSQSAAFKPQAESFLRFVEDQIKSGISSDDVGKQLINASGRASQFAEALARANPLIQEQIIRIQSSNLLDDKQKQEAIDTIIKQEAYKRTLMTVEQTLRQLEFDKLKDATSRFVVSLQRMYDNMDRAINKTTYELAGMTQALALSNGALSGSPKIGNTDLLSVNILRNRNAYSQQEQSFAMNQAADLFGSEKTNMQGLLQISESMQNTVLSTINKVLEKDPNASDEKIAAGIRVSMDKALADIGLPPEIGTKMSYQIQQAFIELRKNRKDTLGFDELAEQVPQLSKTIGAAKAAEEVAIRALEFWQKNVNDYAEAMNQSVEYQLQANQALQKARDLEIKTRLELAQALGKTISLNDQQKLNLEPISNLTGGLVNPTDIQNNILQLNAARAAQQQAVDSAAQKGPAGRDELMMMTKRLSSTNLALKQNYDALTALANNTDMASAALAKISEVKEKIQAGSNFIEKLVTSSPDELINFNRALRNLTVNMGRGQNNSTAEERSASLQVFGMIAPLLGDSAQQNALKANVLESMLLESNIGIDNMMGDVIASLRDPQNNDEAAQAIQYYRDSIDVQRQSEKALSEIAKLMAKNTEETAASKLAKSIEGVKLDFKSQQLEDIKNQIIGLRVDLGNRNVGGAPPAAPAAPKSQGGLIYAAAGQLIDFKPQGTDTVPAMLTPGEFVVNRSATAKNLPLLQSINKGYQNGGKVSYYQDGGLVIDRSWSSRNFSDDAKSRSTEDKVTKQSYTNLDAKAKEFNSPLPGPLFKNRFSGISAAGQAGELSLVYELPKAYFATNVTRGLIDDLSKNEPTFQNLNLDPKLGLGYATLRFLSGGGKSTSYPDGINSSLMNNPSSLAQKLGFIMNDTWWIKEPFNAYQNNRLPIRKDDVAKIEQSYDYVLRELSSLDLKTIKAAIDARQDSAPKLEDPIIQNRAITTSDPTSGAGYDDIETTIYGLSSDVILPKNKHTGILSTDPSARMVTGNSGFTIGVQNSGWGRARIFADYFNDPQLKVHAYQDGSENIKALYDKASRLEETIQADLDAIKSLNNYSYRDSDKAARTKDYILKLKSLFNNSIFSATFNKDYPFDKDNIEYPITLYNIDDRKDWLDRTAGLQDIDADKKFAKNDFIRIVDENKKVRDFPWINSRLPFNTSNKNKELIPYLKYKSNNFTGLDQYKDMFEIPYYEVQSKLFDPEIQDFVGDIKDYLVVDVGQKRGLEKNPLSDAPANSRLYFNTLAELANVVQTNTPLPGKDLPRGFEPYKYSLKAPLSGRLGDIGDSENILKDILIENSTITDSTAMRLIALERNNTNMADMSDLIIEGSSFQKAATQRDTDLAKQQAQKTLDTQAAKDRTLQADEAFTEAKRVTIARYAWKFLQDNARDPNLGINLTDLGHAPENLAEVAIPSIEANQDQTESSRIMRSVTTDQYAKLQAWSNLFGILYLGKDRDAEYLKRMGFSLKDEAFPLASAVPPTPAAINFDDPTQVGQQKNILDNIDYFAEYRPQESIDRLMRRIMLREITSIKEAKGSPDIKLDRNDRMKKAINDSFEGAEFANVSDKGERTVIDKPEAVNTYGYFADRILSPSSQYIPRNWVVRQNQLDILREYYAKAKDPQGQRIYTDEYVNALTPPTVGTPDFKSPGSNLDKLNEYIQKKDYNNIVQSLINAFSPDVGGANSQVLQFANNPVFSAELRDLYKIQDLLINTEDSAATNLYKDLLVNTKTSSLFDVYTSLKQLQNEAPKDPLSVRSQDSKNFKEWMDQINNWFVGSKLDFIDNIFTNINPKARDEYVLLTSNRAQFPDSEWMHSWLSGKALQPAMLATGGMVYASNGQLINFQPQGTDTVPAMLTPGEFVVNRQATQQNLGLLKAINNGSNGYSSGGVIYASDGALVENRPTQTTKAWWNIYDGALKNIYEEITYGQIPKIIGPASRYPDKPEWGMWTQSAWPKEYEKLRTQIVKWNKEHPDQPKKMEYGNTYDFKPDANNIKNASDWSKQDLIAWDTAINRYEFTQKIKKEQERREYAEAVAYSREKQKRQALENNTAGAYGVGLSEGAVATAAIAGTAILTSMIPGVGFLLAPIAAGVVGSIMNKHVIPNIESSLGVKEYRDQLEEAHPYAFAAGTLTPAVATLGTSLAVSGGKQLLEGQLRDRILAGGIGGGTDFIAQGLVNKIEGKDFLDDINLTQIGISAALGASLGAKEGGEARRKLGLLISRISPKIGANLAITSAELSPRIIAEILDADAFHATAVYDEWVSRLIASGEIEPRSMGLDDQGFALPRSTEGAMAGKHVVGDTFDASLGDKVRSGAGGGGAGMYLTKDPREAVAYLRDIYQKLIRNGSSPFEAYNQTGLLYGKFSSEMQEQLKKAYLLHVGAELDSQTLSVMNETLMAIGAKPMRQGISVEDAINNYVLTLRAANAANPSTNANTVGYATGNLQTRLQNSANVHKGGIGQDIVTTNSKAFESGTLGRTTVSELVHSMEKSITMSEKIGTATSNAVSHSLVEASGSDKHEHYDDKHTAYRRSGGLIYASNGQLVNFTPRGTDTVPAMLTPGEFVINRASTEKYRPVLEAINSGSYNYGGIVKYLQNGGYLYPNYYQTGGLAYNRKESFDFASFMQGLTGLLVSVLPEAIQKGMQNTQLNKQNSTNGVSSIDSDVLNKLNEFTNRLKSVADTLAGLSAIPSDIRVTGKHDINVVINGDKALQSLKPDLAQLAADAIKNGLQKLVNKNSPVDFTGLVMPSDKELGITRGQS